jgi:hypothetical protein
LGCSSEFPTTGDLDYHLHVTHGYRHTWRIVSSFAPGARRPRSAEVARHSPGEVDRPDTAPAEAAATSTATRPSGSTATSHSRHRDQTHSRQRRGKHALDTRRRF